MRVAHAHFLCLVARPSIDHPLVDSSGGAVADEAVTEDVPAADFLPFAVQHCLLQVMAGFIGRNGIFVGTWLAIALALELAGKRVWAGSFRFQPLLDDGA